MADIGLYVFGTSILWGQGHNDDKKIHTRIKQWLERKHGATVRVRHYPHSGAVLKGAAGPGRKRLYGEVPDPWPSIWTQINEARKPKDKQVCILLDGGINDVGIFNLVNPFYSRQKLRRETKKACYQELLDVLLRLGGKYKGADTYVLGYYQILASRLRKANLERLLFAFRVCEPADLVGVDFVSRAVENCRIFWRDSDKHIARAAKKAHEQASNSSGSVTFVKSGFKPTEGLFGKRTLLFKLGQIDPKADDRIVPCWKALRKGRSGIHCYPAATGHPNVRGVNRYVKSLKALSLL